MPHHTVGNADPEHLSCLVSISSLRWEFEPVPHWSVAHCPLLHPLFCLSGRSRHIHDKLNVTRLCPEGTNHSGHGSEALCPALKLFGPFKISLTSINCRGSQARVEKYSQYIKLFVNLSSIGTLNLLEEILQDDERPTEAHCQLSVRKRNHCCVLTWCSLIMSGDLLMLIFESFHTKKNLAYFQSENLPDLSETFCVH